jgi:hypothetical protein
MDKKRVRLTKDNLFLVCVNEKYELSAEPQNDNDIFYYLDDIVYDSQGNEVMYEGMYEVVFVDNQITSVDPQTANNIMLGVSVGVLIIAVIVAMVIKSVYGNSGSSEYNLLQVSLSLIVILAVILFLVALSRKTRVQ